MRLIEEVLVGRIVRPLNSKIKQFQDLVIKLANQIEKSRNEAFRDFSIRPESSLYLEAVEKLSLAGMRGVRPSEVARELSIGAASSSRMMKRLEANGLIRLKHQSPQNVEIFLTTTSKNMLAALKQIGDRSIYAIQALPAFYPPPSLWFDSSTRKNQRAQVFQTVILCRFLD